MPILTLPDLADALPSGERLFGLDLGTKTIGVAISDSGLSVATAVETIRRTRFRDDAQRLEALADGRGVGGLVLGLPVNMDGSEGPRCQSVRQFAENLLERRDWRIAFWDERWSTMAVERAMLAADLTRAKRAKSVDRLAATYILQGALDSLAAARRARP